MEKDGPRAANADGLNLRVFECRESGTSKVETLDAADDGDDADDVGRRSMPAGVERDLTALDWEPTQVGRRCRVAVERRLSEERRSCL